MGQRVKVVALRFIHCARKPILRIRTIGFRMLKIAVALRLSLILLTGSLVGTAYLLGFFFESRVPYYEIALHKTCSAPQKNLVYFRPEPISGSARMLYMRLTDWDFKGTCTAVRVSLTDPTIKAHLISEDTAPAGDDHDLVLNNLSGSGETASYEGSTFADPPYQAFQRAKGTTLTKLILDWPAAQWIGFAKKGLTLNFYVTEEKNQGEGVVVTLFLPIGYTLESTTAPAPQQISVNGNAYTFVLAPEIPSVNGDTKLTPSLKVVYESELRRKMQDYLLFVLATIFGAALQLAIDGVRTMNRKA